VCVCVCVLCVCCACVMFDMRLCVASQILDVQSQGHVGVERLSCLRAVYALCLCSLNTGCVLCVTCACCTCVVRAYLVCEMFVLVAIGS